MNIYKVCYCPDVTEECENVIKNNVTHSMISIEEDSKIYEIDFCIATLYELEFSNKEDIEYLKDLDCQFIEF